MKQHITNLLIFIVCVISFKILNAQPSSTFTTGAESWTSVNEPSGTAPAIYWQSGGGYPGGCIMGTDGSAGTWYFVSPSTFSGDLSAYYGCNIEYSIKQNTNLSQYNAADIMIVSTDGSRLVYDVSSAPSLSFTTVTVPLTAGQWKNTTIFGSVATAAEMNTALSNVASIRIRGDYSTVTSESVWLDNVKLYCDAIILPVELTSFEATEKYPGTSQLVWTTATETNCLAFEIEKSTDGIVFSTIGTVKGNGTTVQMHTYQFNDDDFNFASYYRLKQIDIDGNYKYSDIIFLNAETSFQSQVLIYPNPASNLLYINNSGNKLFTAIAITDMYGKQMEFTLTTSTPSQQVLDISKLPAGMYMLILYSGTKKESHVFQRI